MQEEQEQEQVLTNLVDSRRHLVQLVGTYIRTVRESKVDERPFPEEVLFGKGFSVVRLHLEGPTYHGTANGARFALFFCWRIVEV